MKKLVFSVFLFTCVNAGSQPLLPYEELINSTPEIQLTDSLNINVLLTEKRKIDSIIVKKMFSFVLPSSANNRLKNRNYYLSGKITTGTNFNLLVLLEEKKKADSNSAQVLYLVTTKKDGSYIASIEAAVVGNRKKSTYNTSCWLFKDYSVVQDSKIITNERSYATLTKYTINGGGRFILAPNY